MLRTNGHMRFLRKLGRGRHVDLEVMLRPDFDLQPPGIAEAARAADDADDRAARFALPGTRMWFGRKNSVAGPLGGPLASIAMTRLSKRMRPLSIVTGSALESPMKSNTNGVAGRS